MKRSVLLSAWLLSLASVQAQDAAKAVSDLFSPRRIVKTNLAGYALLVANVNYEQKVGAHTTVGLMGGYKLPQTIRLEAIGKLDGEHQTYTGNISPEGVFMNPYFRFYTGPKAFTGFYLEAFMRYYNYTYEVPYDYDKNGRTIHANLDGTANGTGGGLAIGVQLPLAPRVFLDLNFGYGLASGDAHVQTHDPNLEAEDYQNIKRNIENHRDDADVKIMLLDNVISSIDANANNSSAWADIKGQMFPIVRGGVAIGFAF